MARPLEHELETETPFRDHFPALLVYRITINYTLIDGLISIQAATLRGVHSSAHTNIAQELWPEMILHYHAELIDRATDDINQLKKQGAA